MSRMSLPSRWAFFCALAYAVLSIAPALAAEPVFPLNSHIGLIPPPDFAPTAKFPGFEYTPGSNNAAIVIVEFPPQAYAEIEKAFTDEQMKTRGFKVEARGPVTLNGAWAFFVSGIQSTAGTAPRREILLVAGFQNVTALISVQITDAAKAAVTEAAVTQSFTTVVTRTTIPDAEKLAVLPYKLTQLAGFRIVRSSNDGSAVLTDGPNDIAPAVAQPFVLMSVVRGDDPKPEERDSFARRLFSSAPGIKEVKIIRAEPLRMGNLPGYEIVAEAKDAASGVDVNAVHWIRFAAGGYVQMFAISRRDAWASVFPRLRSIRDGVQVR